MIVAGFGWRQGATLASLRAALAEAQATLIAGDITTTGPLVLLAAAHDKAEAPCLQALAAELKLPVCAVPRARVVATPTATRSAAVLRLRGSGSVAEAAARAAAESLVATAAAAHLLHPRAVSPDRLATCALATFPPLPTPLP